MVLLLMLLLQPPLPARAMIWTLLVSVPFVSVLLVS